MAHTAFAAILVGSLAAHGRSADALDGVSLEPSVLKVAGSNGWRLLKSAPTSGTVTRTLAFEATGCLQPVLVSWRLSTFEEETAMQSASEPAYTRRYIYFDRTWERPNRLGAFVERVKYGALEMLRLTEYTPSWYLLLVETPPDCHAANAVDWRPVWNRSNLAAAQENLKAAIKN